MGINNAELFNNLGLCCFYAQQYDMTLACMERALSTAEDETLGKLIMWYNDDLAIGLHFFIGEVWYNLGNISLSIGDTSLAFQCFRLALSANNNHAEAFNNLAVLELRKGNVDQARAFFQVYKYHLT